MRVLGLAYKAVAPEVAARGGWAARPRAEAEEGLRFAGFIAFACKTRADSPTVIQVRTAEAAAVCGGGCSPLCGGGCSRMWRRL